MRNFVEGAYGTKAIQLLEANRGKAGVLGEIDDERLARLTSFIEGTNPEFKPMAYNAIMSTLERYDPTAFQEAQRYQYKAIEVNNYGAILDTQTFEPVQAMGYQGAETAPVTDFRSVDEGPLVRGPTGLEEQEAGGRMSRPATVPPVQRGDVPMRAAPTRAAKVGEFSGSEEYITNTLLTGDRNSVEYAEAYVAAREMGILEKIEQQAPQETPTEAEGRVGTRWTLFR
jgi:hypothetical protein